MLILLLISILIVAVYWMFFLRGGELGDKDAYAVLQRLEIEDRQVSPRRDVVVYRSVFGSRYNALGLTTGVPLHPRFWVLLNSLSKDGEVMVMPEGVRFQGKCVDIDKFLAEEKAEGKVASFLRENCQK